MVDGSLRWPIGSTSVVVVWGIIVVFWNAEVVRWACSSHASRSLFSGVSWLIFNYDVKS